MIVPMLASVLDACWPGWAKQADVFVWMRLDNGQTAVALCLGGMSYSQNQATVKALQEEIARRTS